MLKRKFLVLAIVLTLLVMVGYLVWNSGIITRLQARDHLNKGVKAYEVQRYVEAEQQFKDSIQLDPDLTTALLYLATTYRQRYRPGDSDEKNIQAAQLAILTFEEVLSKVSEDPGLQLNAIANIAGIYFHLEEFDKAKQWHKKRLEVDPSNPEPLYGIGTINWQLSNGKTGVNGSNVGNLDDEEKQRIDGLAEEGIEALKRALEINPRYTEAMSYLNLLYREKAYLSSETEEKDRWEREADKLALQAMEVRRELEREEEHARREVFSGQDGD